MEIIKLLGIFIILNAIVYLLGSFIAFDFNCLNWSIMRCGPGRACVIIIEIVTLGMSLKVNE
jgi:hypothetical protein